MVEPTCLRIKSLHLSCIIFFSMNVSNFNQDTQWFLIQNQLFISNTGIDTLLFSRLERSQYYIPNIEMFYMI